MRAISAHAVRAAVLDPGSWICWDEPIGARVADGDSARSLRTAADHAKPDEAVVTGEGRIGGRRVALLLSEFEFMAGSIGAVAADRLCSAIRRATQEKIPLIASTASGGTRMQEGTPAFLRMIDIVRAIVEHRAAGLLYLVHLRHPTTGGVWASWGALGHVTLAEPGALVGLIGPKVYERTEGRPFPSGVQVAENLTRCGVIDAVVTTGGLRDTAAALLELLCERVKAPPHGCRRLGPATSPDPWAAVEATRVPDRISVADLLAGCDTVLPLNGTSSGGSAASVVLTIARINGMSCVVVGQDRRAQTSGHPLGPGAMLLAQRGMALAQSLGLPLVTVVDTPGVDISADAENRGLARQIAACLAMLATMTVPTVSVLLGQGGGAGALALLPADRTVATEHSWLAPLPPEGASAIQFGNTRQAPEMARRQQIGVDDLYRDGRVHAIVPRRQGDSIGDLAVAILAEVRWQLDQLLVEAALPPMGADRGALPRTGISI